MKTKERLAAELRKVNAPSAMIERAELGEYDDYESNSATPIVRLVNDCRRAGLQELANRAMRGEFDGTEEEANAWYLREGKHLIP